MKIRTEIDIAASPQQVWAAFDNAAELGRWKPTLEHVEHVRGEPGERGSIARHVYAENGRTFKVIELITESREPHFRAASYDAPSHTAIVVNHFESADGGTRWVAYANVAFRGLRRLATPWLKKSFTERVENDMQRFKLMLESDLVEDSI